MSIAWSFPLRVVGTRAATRALLASLTIDAPFPFPSCFFLSGNRPPERRQCLRTHHPTLVDAPCLLITTPRANRRRRTEREKTSCLSKSSARARTPLQQPPRTHTAAALNKRKRAAGSCCKAPSSKAPLSSSLSPLETRARALLSRQQPSLVDHKRVSEDGRFGSEARAREGDKQQATASAAFR